MDVKTILVGVDFSPTSEHACRQAIAIARRVGARVVLAHAAALPAQPEGLPASMQGTADAYLRVLRERATSDQRALAELGDRLSGSGAEISQVLVDGFADEALLDAARDLPAELIVTGSRGRRGLSRLLLGSVAEKVVRGASVPVLVARGERDAGAGGFRRVLVATDFSDAAERGLRLALALADPDPGDAVVEAVHVWQLPSLSRAHAADEVEATVADMRAAMQDTVAERGRQLLDAHPDPAGRLRFEALEGDAQDTILELAAARGADLVVVGGHGTRGLRRLLLGSVAEAIVRHAPCSVLVAR